MSAMTAPREARALAARLVWGSIDGPALTAHERTLVGQGLGGVVLFSRHVESREQVRRLIDELRVTAPGPIHVAVDQQRGHVVRLGEPLIRFPSATALAATGSERLARAVAAATARELAALGIDVVIAPDLDIAPDPDNSIDGITTPGSDPTLVARLRAAMVEGYLAGGVLPIARPTPGHGRTSVDPRLAPFAAAVAAGVPGLVTAQVVDDPIDGRPASRSQTVVERLRGDLGFDGLLVTDALVADTIAGRVADEQTAVEAVAAGADVAMALEPAGRVIEALAIALDRGILPRARVRQAIRRVDAFAARAGGGAAGAGWLSHAGLAREVAEALGSDEELPLPR